MLVTRRSISSVTDQHTKNPYPSIHPSTSRTIHTPPSPCCTCIILVAHRYHEWKTDRIPYNASEFVPDAVIINLGSSASH